MTINWTHLVALLIVVGIIVGACMTACDLDTKEERLATCKNVARDAFHNPEEYAPGSGNRARITSMGVQVQNIGTLGPAQQDCEAKHGN